ncbi:MAG TPA: c-type cytochrome biogenesis protein CcmI [Usitatibacter sp.]|nr:c-type cytochrome biogenesis protein CcmI [Usitatibacter sp.]
MAVFWILATLMTLVALAFVLVPLLRARPAASPSRVEANLEVLRSQRREIESDVADGTLPREARDEALDELVERAEEDLAPVPGETLAPRKPWLEAALAAIGIPLLAFGVYLAVGNPAATDPKLVARPASPDEAQIVAMVENLARKVRERPDDAQGWALLARSMAALGRFEESADAYAHLAKLVPGNPDVLADYADALGMAQGRNLLGRPYELAREALRIDPRHRKALALAGTAAVDGGDFAGAVAHWQRLAMELPADSPDRVKVQGIIDEVRGRAAAEGKHVAASSPVAAAPAAPVGAVSGSVSLAPALAANVSGTEILFIFARSEGGPRMPLAVVRASARELPFKFALDDSQAMAPNAKLSGAQSVRIEARISKSGNAAPQPGDLVGSSGVVKPGARGVQIVVDKVLP